MCQLLAMNCNVPTDICFSFAGFQARGGLTDDHKDGWGIAFFEGKGIRYFLDHEPSARSAIAELVKNYPIKSKNVIAHIRKATLGPVALENTHPFLRELWGFNWIFAHNGTLKDFTPVLDGPFRPVGQTDSERAFCWILQELARTFGETNPTPAALFDVVARLAVEIGAHGTFNFLFSNGESLIAHCSTTLAYVVRQAPFRAARLKDRDVTVDFSQVTTSNDRVAIIATTPLTDNEAWTTIAPGTALMFQNGQLAKTLGTVAGPNDSELK